MTLTLTDIRTDRPGITLREIARKHVPPESLADRIERHARLPEHARRTPERCIDLLEIADAVRELEGAAHARKRGWRAWWNRNRKAMAR